MKCFIARGAPSYCLMSSPQLSSLMMLILNWDVDGWPDKNSCNCFARVVLPEHGKPLMPSIRVLSFTRIFFHEARNANLIVTKAMRASRVQNRESAVENALLNRRRSPPSIQVGLSSSPATYKLRHLFVACYFGMLLRRAMSTSSCALYTVASLFDLQSIPS